MCAAADPRRGIKSTTCPRCGYKMDAATHIGKGRARPKPGDFSLCLQCGQILRFDQQLEPVMALERELAELDAETLWTLRRGQAAINLVVGPEMRARRRPPSENS
jgi:hypothetical protein